MLKAFDPLLLHVTERFLGRRGKPEALSFGASLDGARDILLVVARELVDLLAIVPAARALRQRFRLARVHVLASPPCAEVLRHRSEVFGVVPWTAEDRAVLSREFLEAVREIRRHSFDLAVAVDEGVDRLPRVLGAISGAKLRVGVHPEGRDPALNLVVTAPRPGGYRPVQSLEFLSFLGIPRETLAPGWEIPEADREYARRLLHLRRRGREGWLLGVDPGPGLSGVRPAPEKLAWLVDRLAASRGAVPVILTEDREDAGVREFESDLKCTPLDVPLRGLRDVFSFLRCCDLFLTGNTSLFHFATSLGVPTLGLLRPEEEERWIPPETPGRRLLRVAPGVRIAEASFLGLADSVRRSRVAELPLRLAPAESEAPGRAKPSANGGGEPEASPDARASERIVRPG